MSHNEDIGEGRWGGKKEGNPQTELAQGHSACHLGNQVAHQASDDVDDHEVEGGSGEVNLAGFVEAPRIYFLVEGRGIAEHNVADERVQKESTT